MRALDDIRQRWAETSEWEVHDGVLSCYLRLVGRSDVAVLPRRDPWKLSEPQVAIANAPTDIEYLLRRLELAEAVIKAYRHFEFGEMFHRDLEKTIQAWREVAK